MRPQRSQFNGLTAEKQIRCFVNHFHLPLLDYFKPHKINSAYNAIYRRASDSCFLLLVASRMEGGRQEGRVTMAVVWNRFGKCSSSDKMDLVSCQESYSCSTLSLYKQACFSPDIWAGLFFSRATSAGFSSGARLFHHFCNHLKGEATFNMTKCFQQDT